MSRQLKTLEIIECDVCHKETRMSYSNIELEASSDRFKSIDTYKIELSGNLENSGKVEDLCKDCAIQHLTIALDHLKPKVKQ